MQGGFREATEQEGGFNRFVGGLMGWGGLTGGRFDGGWNVVENRKTLH